MQEVLEELNVKVERFMLNELKNSNAKLGKTVDFGCENVNIILDKGKMWIKKPCNGKIMVHFVKAEPCSLHAFFYTSY